jgi:hypothetical protein
VVIFQGRPALLVEAPDPTADRLRIQPKRRGDGRRRLALMKRRIRRRTVSASSPSAAAMVGGVSP